MSFLDNVFKAQNDTLPSGWKELAQEEQIEQIIADSHRKPVAIFKHSIRCGTSAMAKYQLEAGWDFNSDELDFYYLDLIRNRPASNRVAETLGVRHQSPQVILIHKGQPVYNDSHHMISIEALKKALEQSAS
jgi:bacillithiol system protein YtxJ